MEHVRIVTNIGPDLERKKLDWGELIKLMINWFHVWGCVGHGNCVNNGLYYGSARDGAVGQCVRSSGNVYSIADCGKVWSARS